MAHTEEIPTVVEVPEDDVAQEALPLMPPPALDESLDPDAATGGETGSEEHPVESDKLPPIPA